MPFFVVNPRIWLVLLIIFGIGLGRRLFRQWQRDRERAASE